MQRSGLSLFVLLPLVVALAACGPGQALGPTLTPTPTNTPTPTATATPTAAPTSTPTPTATPDPLANADSARGQRIFETGGGILDNNGCSYCHTADGSELDTLAAQARLGGPTLLGIAETALERAPDLTPAEYIWQSIMEPEAVVPEGYKPMTDHPSKLLNEQDIYDLTAYLLSLE